MPLEPEPASELRVEDVLDMLRALSPHSSPEELLADAENLLNIIADEILQAQVPPESKGLSDKTSQ